MLTYNGGKELLSEFKPKDVKEDTKVYKFEKEDTMSQNNLLNNTNTTKIMLLIPHQTKIIFPLFSLVMLILSHIWVFVSKV